MHIWRLFLYIAAQWTCGHTPLHPLNRYKEQTKGSNIKNVTSRDIYMNIAHVRNGKTYRAITRCFGPILCFEIFMCRIYISKRCVVMVVQMPTCACDTMSRVVDIWRAESKTDTNYYWERTWDCFIKYVA